MSDLTDYQAVLLDVEGTTTPVHFVYEVLFPYAQRELQVYLEQHWNDPHVQDDIDAMVDHIAQMPRDAKGQPCELPEDQSTLEAFRSAVIEHIQWQMDNDHKNTPLKSLQGRIWRSGYVGGEIKAPLFDDVPRAFVAWHKREIPVYIYSSGSVDAQKLLFAHTEDGDLSEYISGYFDTRTGHKKNADSYEIIAGEMGLPSNEILFVTDNLDEARAANEAGMKVALSVRPGNAHLDAHDFPEIHTFDALFEG